MGKTVECKTQESRSGHICGESASLVTQALRTIPTVGTALMDRLYNEVTSVFDEFAN